MANKDFEDNNQDFDFSWDEPDEGGTASGQKKAKQVEKEADFSADFSEIDFSDEKPASASKVEEDNDFGFQFDAMPTQTSFVSESEAHRGDPADEFAEFGFSNDEDHDNHVQRGSFSEDDEFDQAFAPSTENGFGGMDDVSEVLEKGNYIGQTASDPYNQIMSDDSQKAASKSSASTAKPLVSKLILPVGLAATFAVVGWIGYTKFLPSSTAEPTVVAKNDPQPTDPAFPKTLPGQTPSLPSAGSSVAKPADPSVLPKTATPVSSASSKSNELTFDLPETSPSSAPATPPVTKPVPAASTTAVVTPPTATMPAQTLSSSPSTPEVKSQPATDQFVKVDDFKTVLKRLDEMQTKMTSLDDKVTQLASSFQDKVSIPATPVSLPPMQHGDNAGTGLNANAKPVATVDTVSPPLKPVIIDGVSLAGIAGDVAWVKIGADTKPVKVGDVLEHGGKIAAIREYNSNWIIVTDQGIIVR